jgi:hypothetical protein
MVCFMSQRSRGALGGRWAEAESGVSWTSLAALLGTQIEEELTLSQNMGVAGLWGWLGVQKDGVHEAVVLGKWCFVNLLPRFLDPGHQ